MTGTEPVTLPLELDRPLKQAEPALRGDSITADRYTSNNYLERELDQVWRRVWNIGGVSYQMTEPGDYLTAEIGHESVILVRQADGSAKAFLNVCPHRGTRITESAEGAVERFHCPYHGWQFDWEGAVVAVPDEEDYRESPCGRARLREVLCQERFGLIWYNLDLEAASLEAFLGEQITRELDSHRMEDMVRVLDITAEAEANWKIITDNFNEAYHVKVLHPELIPYIAADYQDCQFDLFSNGHNRGWFPAFMPSQQYGSEVIGEPLKSMAQAWEVNSDDYQGRETWSDLRIAIQNSKRKLGVDRGFSHYAYRSNYQLTDYVIYNLFPNNVITVGPDGVQLLRPRPHAKDAGRCYFDHWWLVNRVAGENMTPSPAGGPDLPVQDAEHEQVVYGEKTLGTTADQDLSIARAQQAGLASSGFQGFWMPNQERRVQAFHEHLNDLMAAE